MPASLPIYTNLPEIPTGYPITGEWEVVTPIARINEITNPSFELNLTGYTAGAGTFLRTATKQYHGVYSAYYTPSIALTDGFYYNVLSTTLNQFRAISCKFLGQPNVSYALTVASSGGVDRVVKQFKGTGRWQWVYLYYLETAASASRRIYFRKDGSTDTHTYYVDGVQSELISAGEFVSTYIDGDQRGLLPNQVPAAYGWNGIPHASSSYRSGLTRAGGQVVPFKRFGFLLLAVLGLGLPQPQNVSTQYALGDGGYPSYTRKPISQFNIVGNLSEGTARNLRAVRSGLSRTLDRDLGILDQQLILRYRHTNECGTIDSDTVVIPCKYVSGFDGASNNNAAQTVNLTFEQYLPNVTIEGEAGAALSVQSSLAWAGIAQRSAAGVWSSLGTGANSIVSDVFYSRNGRIYITGDFTAVSGVAALRAAYYDPSTGTWAAMGTGLNGRATRFVEDANGTIFAVGRFTAAGGVANTNRVARWNPTTLAWSSITPAGAANGDIEDAAVAPDGTLIVAGAFTTINGVASNFIHKYNISTGTWTASYGAGPGASVTELALSYNGSLPYVVTATVNIRKWSGTAWSTIGIVTGPEVVFSLMMGIDGILYAGGQLTSISGVAGNSILGYNGTTWFPLGLGLLYTGGGPGTNQVLSMTQLPDGSIVAVGNFDTSGANTTLSNIATFDGSTWYARDFIPDALGGLVAISSRFDGSLIVAGDGTPALVAGQISITNTGTAQAYPTVRIFGSPLATGKLYIIQNLTTGRAVYFDLSVAANDTITMNFQPDNLSFVSTAYGNVQSTILPGSFEADFFLAPGVNVITVFTSDANITGTIRYNPQYLSLDDLQ